MPAGKVRINQGASKSHIRVQSDYRPPHIYDENIELIGDISGPRRQYGSVRRSRCVMTADMTPEGTIVSAAPGAVAVAAMPAPFHSISAALRRRRRWVTCVAAASLAIGVVLASQTQPRYSARVSRFDS